MRTNTRVLGELWWLPARGTKPPQPIWQQPRGRLFAELRRVEAALAALETPVAPADELFPMRSIGELARIETERLQLKRRRLKLRQALGMH